MSKLRAFAVHLLISAGVIGSFLAVVFFVWYPRPLFEVNGAWNIVKILVSVDVILGPLLTLIVYKKGKKMLKFDLTVIVLLQLIAFGYGAYTLYYERPQFVVFAANAYEVVTQSQTDFDELPAELSLPPPWQGPKWVVARMPTDVAARQNLLSEALAGGRDLAHHPDLYRPYSELEISEVRSQRLDMARIIGDDAAKQRLADAFIARHGGELQEYLFVPILGKEGEALLGFDGASGDYVGALEIRDFGWYLAEEGQQSAQPSS